MILRSAQARKERAKSASYLKKAANSLHKTASKSRVIDLARSLQACAGGPNLWSQVGVLQGVILRSAQAHKVRSKSASYLKKAANSLKKPFKSRVVDLARSLQACAGGPNLWSQVGVLEG